MNQPKQNFLANLDPRIREYYNILAPEGIPDWLIDYIETPEMLHQDQISVCCGMSYSQLFPATADEPTKNAPAGILQHI